MHVTLKKSMVFMILFPTNIVYRLYKYAGLLSLAGLSFPDGKYTKKYMNKLSVSLVCIGNVLFTDLSMHLVVYT